MMPVTFSLTITLCLFVLALAESGLSAITVTSTVNIHVFKENHIVLGPYDSLYFVKVSLFGSTTVGHAGRIFLLLIFLAGLRLFLTGGFALCVELLKLGLLCVGKVEAFKRVDCLALLTGTFLSLYIFLPGSGGSIVVSSLSHAAERYTRHRDKC